MVTKFTFDVVREYIENFRYQLLSNTYVNLQSRIVVRCDKGHVYETSFANFRKGRRCRKCYNERTRLRCKLSYEQVKHIIESEDGYKLLSSDYLNNKQKLVIKCKCGHIYKAVYGSFQQGKRCPKCASRDRGLRTCYKYDFIKSKIEERGHKLLSDSYEKSNVKLKIQCNKGHVYSMTYADFQQGHSCPLCYEDRRGCARRLDYSFVKSEIENIGYQLLSNAYINSRSKLKIQCEQGHIVYMSYNSIKRGRRCKICSRNKVSDVQRVPFDVIKQNIQENGYNLISDTYEGNKHKIKIQCDKGHIYTVRYNNFQQGQRCPRCSTQGVSKAEKDLQRWLSEYINIESNKRFYYDKNKYYEADIYIPSKNIAIEFNGLYHHSELSGKDKSYHLDKTKFFEEQDIQVIHIFENEWVLKQNIVKSIILNKLGLSPNKDYARNCIIKEVDNKTSAEFLNTNHLQGTVGASVKLGLFDKNDELVSLMTFGKCRFNKHYKWEMVRFCHKLNMNVVGGFSRLLKHFTRNYNGSIISYADRRYSDGSVYLKNGFQLSHVSEPNYFYFQKNSYLLESRNKYQKHKLGNLLDDFDPQLSEWQNMQNNGFNRIFDCGNLVFIKE